MSSTHPQYFQLFHIESERSCVYLAFLWILFTEFVEFAVGMDRKNRKLNKAFIYLDKFTSNYVMNWILVYFRRTKNTPTNFALKHDFQHVMLDTLSNSNGILKLKKASFRIISLRQNISRRRSCSTTIDSVFLWIVLCLIKCNFFIKGIPWSEIRSRILSMNSNCSKISMPSIKCMFHMRYSKVFYFFVTNSANPIIIV